MLIKCNYCNKEVYKKPSHLLRYKKLFCSSICKNKEMLKKIEVQCTNCGKLILRNKSVKYPFCNKKCAAIVNNSKKDRSKYSNWNGGIGTYRSRALNTYKLVCCSGDMCPMINIDMPTFMYDVDHINGNRKDSSINNLQILCVWCHRLKHKKK